MNHYLAQAEHPPSSEDRLTKNLLFWKPRIPDNGQTKDADGMTLADDDNALLASFREGNDEAFSRLVIRYQALVVRACRRQVPGDDVDDCVQAVFIVLARRPTAAMRAPALAAWLHRVCSYVCLNARRTKHRQGSSMKRIETAPAITSLSEAQADSVILTQLDTALLRLSERQRAAVLLHAENYSAQEIASRLGVTMENAYKLTQRGLSELRTYFTRIGTPVGAATLMTLLSSNVASAAPVSVPAVTLLLSSSQTGSAGILAQGAATSLTLATAKTALVATAMVATLGASLFFTVEALRSDTVKISAATTITSGNPVAEVATTPAVTSDEELEQERYKQEAEAALAMSVPDYLHEVFDRDMPAAVDYFHTRAHRSREEALKKALSSWMEKDPARASMWALSIKDKDLRLMSVDFISESWSRHDTKNAALWALAIENGRLKYSSLLNVVRTWAETDPQQLVAWSESFPSSERPLPSNFPYFLAMKWAAQDPAACLSWINRLQEPEERRSGRLGYCRGLANKDPQMAFAWIEKNIAAEERAGARRQASLGINMNQPVTWLSNILDQKERSEIVLAVAKLWSDDSWERPFELIRGNENIYIHKFTEEEQEARNLSTEGVKRDGVPDNSLVIYNNRLERVLGIIIAEGAHKDPQKTIAIFDKIDGNKEDLLVLFARNWAEDDPEQATVWATSLVNVETREKALLDAFSLWVFKDPPKAIAWLDALSAENRFDSLDRVVAVSWGLHDASQALAWTEKNKDSGAKQFSYLHLLPILAYSHPDKAISLVSEIDDAVNKSKALLFIAMAWGEKDPKAASVWAESVGDLRESSKALISIGKSWAKRNPKQAAAWAKNIHSQDDRDSVLSEIVAVWSELNPEQAATWASSLENKVDKEKLLEQIVQYWSYEDDGRAAAWAMKMTDKALRNSLLSVAASSHYGGSSDKKKVISWAASLENEDDRKLAVMALMPKWALNHPSEARAWAEALPGGTFRTDALCEVARCLSWKAPAEAAALVLAQEEGAARSDAIAEIVGRWMWTEPAKAAEWLVALPAGVTRQEALDKGLFDLIHNTKRPEEIPAAATIIVTKTMVGVERTRAIWHIAFSWCEKKPENAGAWAKSLADETTRADALRLVVHCWSNKNKKDALSWVETLDEKTKSAVLQKPAKLIPRPPQPRAEPPKAENANEF